MPSRFWGIVSSIVAVSSPLGPLASAWGASGPPDQVPGRVISGGAAPHPATWADMLARDAQRGRPASVQVRVHDRPIAPRMATVPAGPDRPVRSTAAQEQARLNGLIGISTNFDTISLNDQFDLTGFGSIPPDTMGAIGPTHFLQVINSSVAAFSRTGSRASHVTLNSFFTFNDNGITYPRTGAFDPRVLFDRRSDRWYVIALEFGLGAVDNELLLAVSRTNNPLNTIWDRYVIPIGEPGTFTDFPSLATDDNGVYFGATMFPSSGFPFAKIAATPRGPLVGSPPGLGAVTEWTNITDVFSTPQPAHNHDAVGPGDPAWFLAASDTTFANVHYRKIIWSAGSPTLSSPSQVLTTPRYPGFPPDAPALGSGVRIDTGDDRIQMAVIRHQRLWTCRQIGVDSAGGGIAADRSACEWFEIDASGAGLTLVQSGRVFDTATSNPWFYYYPSIMVNGLGNVGMGFSGSRGSDFVSAFVTGRVANDFPGAMASPVLLREGRASYERLDNIGRNRWGDYSYTSLDPLDDLSIWTIQEYVTAIPGSIWGTWTARLVGPGPATPISVSPDAVPQGAANVDVVVTGQSVSDSAFYDPGAGFANRLSATVNGGGVSVNSVTVDGPTQLTMNISVATDAAAGLRTIRVVNPDGQAATSAEGLLEIVCTADAPVLTKQPEAKSACLNGSISFEVAAQSDTPLRIQWRRDGQNIDQATGQTLTITEVSEADEGMYEAVVANDCSSVTSAAAALKVVKPIVLGRAGDLAAPACSTVTLGAVIQGPGAVSLQWRKNGVILFDDGRITGANEVKLTLRQVTAADNGTYDVVAVGDCGQVISDAARLRVTGIANCPTLAPAGAGFCPMSGLAVSMLLPLMFIHRRIRRRGRAMGRGASRPRL